MRQLAFRSLAPFIFACATAFADSVSIDTELNALTREYDTAKYDIQNKEMRAKAFEALRAHVAGLQAKYPQRPELLVWEGWALISHGNVLRNLRTLGMFKQGKQKIEAAIAIDPNLLGATPYCTLGELYVNLPGWPLSFGDEKKGHAYLQKALAMDPSGIQPNLSYAKFLFKTDDYAGSLKYASAASRAPSRPGREKADRDLRSQAEELIAKLKEKLR